MPGAAKCEMDEPPRWHATRSFCTDELAQGRTRATSYLILVMIFKAISVQSIV
jgi:hypothetical protein